MDVCRSLNIDLDETKKPVLFQRGTYSQWLKSKFTCPLVVGDDTTTPQQWSSCEQYMMACKAALFNDAKVLRQILRTQDVRKIKQLGRTVGGFSNKVWNRNKFEIVYTGNLHKFQQNTHLREELLRTHKRLIAEASSSDSIWGIGLHEGDPAAQTPSKWRGQNLLGQAIMVVRHRLRVEQAAAATAAVAASAAPAAAPDLPTSGGGAPPNQGDVARASAAAGSGGTDGPGASECPSPPPPPPPRQTWPFDKIEKRIQACRLLEQQQREAAGRAGDGGGAASEVTAAAAASEAGSAATARGAARSTQPGRKCVLLSTGALNPVHRGHVEMLQAAARHLDANLGYTVLGGFLSPSSDCYVAPKCARNKTPHAAGTHRAEMAAACVDGTPFNMATWEVKHTERWPDFPEVCAELQQVLVQRYPTDNVLVVYVCGTDHAQYCGGLLRAKNMAVCVVQRDGAAGGGGRVSSIGGGQTPWNLFLARHSGGDADTVATYSSTDVRKLLGQFWRARKAAAAGGGNDAAAKAVAQELELAIGGQTLRYIEAHGLYQ